MCVIGVSGCSMQSVVHSEAVRGVHVCVCMCVSVCVRLSAHVHDCARMCLCVCLCVSTWYLGRGVHPWAWL